MKKWKIAILLSGALLSGVAFVGCSSNPSRPSATASQATTSTTGGSTSNRTGTSVGDTAPDFQLAGLDGAQAKLADLHGQPAVLIFWTAWCPVCREEAPHFNELAAKYEPQGVHIIGINIQDSPARTEGGIKDFGIKYRVVRDADASVARSYKVTGTPTILFLDRNGVVRYFGNELPADYSSRLDALVARK